jgi:hypothetical protein
LKNRGVIAKVPINPLPPREREEKQGPPVKGGEHIWKSIAITYRVF